MPESLPLTALVSIHDVMPETRAQVTAMLARLNLPPTAVTLLVVPGRDWSGDDLEWLRGLQEAGHPLAGHGWHHRCQKPVTLYHKLHSLLLSRQVAEHLSFSGEGIVRLVNNCHDWFVQRHLTVSSLYVPPAWALGGINRKQLKSLPFSRVETLSGVHACGSGTLRRLPLVGYEADTPLRAWFLRWFNAANIARAQRRNLPLRIGLHPHDLSLLLAADIPVLLSRVNHFSDYDSLVIDGQGDSQNVVSALPDHSK